MQSFYEAVAQLSLRDVSRFRAKVLFTGRGTPPPQVEGGDEAIKAWVNAKAHAIGYIYESSLDGTVKTVLTLNP
jgi:hypothetical protein